MDIDDYHPALLVYPNFDYTKLLPKAPFIKYLYDKENYETINRIISATSWQQELSSVLVDESADFFNESIHNFHKENIPIKKPQKYLYPLGYSRGLIK